MMADIRMLQEQTALLRAQLSELRDVLKTVGSKLDEQAGVSRKAFADQKLLVDTISSDLRVVREKVDDNNVRISSLSQELEAVRMAMPQTWRRGPGGGRRPAAAGGRASAGRCGTAPGGCGEPRGVAAAVVRPGVGRLRRRAVQPRDCRVRELHPQLSRARNWPAKRSTSSARATTSRGMYREAVSAYDRGISDYPNSKRIPDMYYKRGMALNALGQTDRARESWEYVAEELPELRRRAPRAPAARPDDPPGAGGRPDDELEP